MNRKLQTEMTKPNYSTTIKISINFALSCPSGNIPLFMLDAEDQDTPVDSNEYKRDGSEVTSPRKRNESSAQM